MPAGGALLVLGPRERVVVRGGRGLGRAPAGVLVRGLQAAELEVEAGVESGVVLDRVAQAAEQGRLAHPATTDDEVVLGNPCGFGLIVQIADQPLEQGSARDKQRDELVLRLPSILELRRRERAARGSGIEEPET